VCEKDALEFSDVHQRTEYLNPGSSLLCGVAIPAIWNNVLVG
jgi:hypothetical protein